MLSDESDIGLLELIERKKLEEESKVKDDEIFSGSIQNKVNKWVLVSFKTKSTVKYYVGQITEVNESNPVVNFARKMKKS